MIDRIFETLTRAIKRTDLVRVKEVLRAMYESVRRHNAWPSERARDPGTIRQSFADKRAIGGTGMPPYGSVRLRQNTPGIQRFTRPL